MRRCAVTLLLLALLPAATPAAAQPAPVTTEREQVVQGLRHERFYVRLDGGGVARGNVVRVAPSKRLRVEPKLARGIRGVRTTPQMAAEELDKGGMVVMNGGFWLPAAGGRPHGVSAVDGELLTGPTTQWGRPGHRGTLGFTAGGRLLFSRLGGRLELVRPDGETVVIDDLNYVPLDGTDGELLAYTPPWGDRVDVPPASRVVTLTNVSLPVAGRERGTVTSVRDTSGTVPVPEGGAVLVAHGRARQRLDGLAVGDKVRVKVGVRPLDVPAERWRRSVDILPGGPLIVRDGAMTPPDDWVAEGFSHERHNRPRHPRTAIGRTRDGEMLLVTVDGRQAHSAGMTMWELAELMLDLGAHEALSLDGGGSTTMTVLGRTRNRISDPTPRPVANALVVRYRPGIKVRDPAAHACPPAAVPDPGYTDIASHAHAVPIACAAWYGITTGRTATTFAPDRPVTRAQMASFLARLIDHAAAGAGNARRGLPDRARRFADVPARSPHARAIGRLAAAGIVTGGPGGAPATAYGPGQRVTRAQMATLLARTVRHITGRALPAGANLFADDNGSTHERAINRLAAAGIAEGRSPGLYAPRAPVRRGAMATFLLRTMDLLVSSGAAATPS